MSVREDAKRAVTKLAERGETVVTVESCTGGLLAAAFVSIPSASRCFLGGYVAYRDAIKTRMLGIDPELIARHGAVSKAVTVELAHAARRMSGADWAIATSCFAGPDADEGRSVGEAYVAVGDRSRVRSYRYELEGARDEIRSALTARALERCVGALDAPTR